MMLERLYRCSRCRQMKPAEAFHPNVALERGVHSWCTECLTRASTERQQRRAEAGVKTPQSPTGGRVGAAIDERDALKFSRFVCEHVAWYVGRKAREFEALTGQEAPPHVAAIQSLAASLAAQHPSRRRPGERGLRANLYELVCQDCAERFESRSPTRAYCDACAGKRAAKRRREYRQQPRVKAMRAAQKRRAYNRAAFKLVCEKCGTEFIGKSRKPRFCSTACAIAALPPIEKVCLDCGTAFVYQGRGRSPDRCEVCRGARLREQRRAERLRARARRRAARAA